VIKPTLPSCITCSSRKKGIFAQATEAEVEALDESKNCGSYKAGQVIFAESQRPYGVFCVLEGKVKLTKTSGDGKEQIVRLAAEGDVLGYRAALTGERFSASAVALDDSRVCFVPLETFRHMIDKNAEIAHDLFISLSKALSNTEQQMATLALKPVRERLADALLLLKKVYGKEAPEPFSISLSRENLASLVGTAKETVIRFLSEFKEEGMVDTKGSLITILDANRLVGISQLYD
jgi:CRP-like cAMP-binding protein